MLQDLLQGELGQFAAGTAQAGGRAGAQLVLGGAGATDLLLLHTPTPALLCPPKTGCRSCLNLCSAGGKTENPQIPKEMQGMVVAELTGLSFKPWGVGTSTHNRG